MDMNILLLRLIKLGLNIGVYKLNSESWIDIGNWEKYKQVSENNKIDK